MERVPAHDFGAVKVAFTICYTRLDDRRVVAFKPRHSADGAWDATALAAALHETFQCAYTPATSGYIFAL
ncbi:MAG TPA: hypothetical protein VFN37_01975 [Candidatus Baltobacteraceae bacterium]|nr:hypothetical protein [Candidatus Baltobacteraceae bacterium]